MHNVIARIQSTYKTLGPTSRLIADFILSQPDAVMRMSVTELSEQTGSSQGSVVNFCQNLGLSGFQQLKLSLAQAVVQPVQYIQEDLARTTMWRRSAARCSTRGSRLCAIR
ncbi:MurR/RpiR family transcriptional regulator [Caulobacter sp. B11]|uniref:MurR/RpiR family transcriptional regulator n=1 Tax=Caulobacter sp. B11 TaxID=2048899 RepID=UPI001F200D84|nr:hypothetical protein [Caulobacter sp. B11]